MTEDEWLVCTDPKPMLEYLRSKASERKLRLFACACPKLILERLGEEERRVVAIGERYADNAASPEEVEEARRLALRGTYQGLWLTVVADIAGAMLPVFTHEYYLWVDDYEWYCQIVRDIIGNPFCPVTLNPTWHTSTVTTLAQALYDDRQLTCGYFDNQRMGVLADALEEVGCDNTDLLNHCRSERPHVRGCWLIDILLRKS